MTDSTSTIYALSTGAGVSAIAVVRVSGPKARFGLETLTRVLPPPRRASLRRLVHRGIVLDHALVLWMPGPASFTGEDMVEYHVHGGRAVVAAVLAALSDLGHRPAIPGEFTRRAFALGRMDMTAVEGLGDLLVAETELQRRQALRQAEGTLGRQAVAWRTTLIHAMAVAEAHLDFADEGDVVDRDSLDGLHRNLASLAEAFAAALRGSAAGERLRDGLTVVIAGPPNAGKSTLLNALAGRDVAIVTPIPGTTRDVIEVRMDLGGVPVTVVDTAGLRASDDPVEAEGIRRARARIEMADLVLALRPVDAVSTSIVVEGITVWDVVTKIDSIPDRIRPSRSLAVSGLSGEGMDALLERLTRWASDQVSTGEPALVTRERHRIALTDAELATRRAIDGLGPDRLELVAEDIRLSIRALDSLIGTVGVDDVLDALFAGFCIGK